MGESPFVVLVVDDNEVNRELYSRYLELEGYRVLTADDGLEALDRVAEQRVDLVLLDVMMPELDGFGVLERLRAEHSPEELPVMVRLSVTDWADGGWGLPQALELCRHLKALGVDLIDCSSGGLVPDAVIPAAPGFQAPFAAAIREQVGIATGAVGLIKAAVQAEQIIATGSADVVLLARELLRDPYWPIHAAAELKVAYPWPVQYERAKP